MMWFRKKEESMDIEQAIVQTKAELARVKLLPESDFTYFKNFILVHGIDEKPLVIKRLEAKLVWLETIARGGQ